MNKIKKGDIVGRISYGKDILFTVERIIKTNGKDIVILKGITVRVEADAFIDDLEIIQRSEIEKNLRSLDKRLDESIKKYTEKRQNYFDLLKLDGKRSVQITHIGSVLHLDRR